VPAWVFLLTKWEIYNILPMAPCEHPLAIYSRIGS
jgi:hypothetical protein